MYIRRGEIRRAGAIILTGWRISTRIMTGTSGVIFARILTAENLDPVWECGLAFDFAKLMTRCSRYTRTRRLLSF